MDHEFHKDSALPDSSGRILEVDEKDNPNYWRDYRESLRNRFFGQESGLRLQMEVFQSGNKDPRFLRSVLPTNLWERSIVDGVPLTAYSEGSNALWRWDLVNRWEKIWTGIQPGQ